MRRALLLSLLVAGALAAHGDEKNAAPSPEQGQLERSALTLMKDIAPQAPVSDTMVMVSSEKGRAIWGKIFGDAQIGALVAVRADKAKENDDASLCLLLWQDGWKFAQWAGKVSISERTDTWSPIAMQNWNWGLKQRMPGEPYYVTSGLDLNTLSSQKHPSWLCDPKTHSLQPTGWPEDAIPSLSSGTITFRRCEKSGDSAFPTAFEVDEFDGKPGRNLATYTDDLMGGPISVSVPDPATGKRVIWRIRPFVTKYEAGHDRRSLCYSPADGNLGSFHEDATVDVQWGTESYPTSATNFLIWRLTGIERNAQMGFWDEDHVAENERWKNTIKEKPARAVVVGIPEAVKAFSWPLNPVPPAPDGANSK
jgi:hypothetical protein